MADTTGGSGAAAAFRGLLTTVIILGLLSAVGWLLAERNAHHYFLRAEGRTVLVERGWFLPFGHGPFRPRDPALAQAYAPITLPEGVALPGGETGGEEELDDRYVLDQRLGELLLAAAKARLAPPTPDRRAAGAYLDRATLLPDLTSDQRRELQSRRAEVAFFEASDRISGAITALQDARQLLELATTGSPTHAREAADLLDHLRPALDGLLRATRGADILSPEEAAPHPSALPADGGTPALPGTRDGG